MDLSSDHIVALYAGDLAQLAHGEAGQYLPITGGANDEQRARDIALAIAERENMGFARAGEILDRARARAGELVAAHRDVIERVADELLQRQAMSGGELRRAMKMKPAWFLHDDEPRQVPARACSAATRGVATDYKPVASDWQHDGNGGFIAKRTFTARIDGEVYEIVAGKDRVIAGHALVAGLREPKSKPRRR